MNLIFLLFLFLMSSITLAEETPTTVPETTVTTPEPTHNATESSPQESALQPVMATTPEEPFPTLWQKTYPRLEKLLILQDQQEHLPQSAWFSKDQTSNQKKINELIQEALAILEISSAQQYAKTIHQLEDKITKTRQTISEYREKQRSAPKNAYLATTSSQYEGKIKQLEQEISVDNQTIQQKKQEITQQLQKMGIQIGQEHIETLLNSITGDKTIEMSVVFNHVKAIFDELSKLMVENEKDTQAARRYYGMYTVLLNILITMQQDFIRTIEQDYLPKIQNKIVENQKLMETTQQLLSESGESHRREMYEKNLENQEIILKTADLYKKHLVNQASKVYQVMAELSQDYALAMNTYKTVKISGELVDMIRSSHKQFNTLANLQLPPLIPFENLQMKIEYEKLTTELRQSEQLK